MISYIVYEMNANGCMIKVVSQENIRSYWEQPTINYVLYLNFAQWI